MAKKLLKLAMSAVTTTEAIPTVSRFFYSATAVISDTSITIAATSFIDDDGSAAAALATAAANNGYYLLFVNGELQQSAIYTVGGSGSALTISTTDAFTIPLSAVVTLATTNFAPDSVTIVTT
jgi:hypothetical protein